MSLLLYLVCCNVCLISLPALLRSVRLPVSARYYSSNPQREFDGLWLNCLLYADDVVLIGAAEVMPRLLKAAEEHSFSLGYRWNPAKCVMLNCAVSLGGPQFKLSADPTECYLCCLCHASLPAACRYPLSWLFSPYCCSSLCYLYST
ncbi:hypothetical protein G6F43_014035 [Rhizopus delemar]|nr:hypothetical protein G6F43_014035 [Rhizopus delemar]